MRLKLLIIVTFASLPTFWQTHALLQGDATQCELCQVQALDPGFWNLFPQNALIERIGSDFDWVEGPVWFEESLLFSDIPANRIYRWKPDGTFSVFLEQSGYQGLEAFTGAEPGSNGLALDASGRLVICEHGSRRITRLEADGSRTVLAERYAGRRLNSPNDLAFDRNGSLYFTDPPFGLPGQFSDPGKELAFSGIYRRHSNGMVELLSRRLKAPNGLAFSPGGETLYVTDVDPERPAWYAFPVNAQGRLGEPRLLYDASAESGAGRGAPDGLKVDVTGHLFGAGPGAVFVMTAQGQLLGKLIIGTPVANVAWGDDGSTLYITADNSVYRIRTRTRGTGIESEVAV